MRNFFKWSQRAIAAIGSTNGWSIAHYSIGCKAGKALDVEARILAEGLKQLQEQIREVDKSIENICADFADCKLLLSIPGFGPYISAGVLAAIGNPRRFGNVSQVKRLAPLDAENFSI